RKRLSHLYAVFRLTPYSRHSSATGSSFASTFMTSSLRTPTTDLAFHGIAPAMPVKRVDCHPCPGAILLPCLGTAPAGFRRLRCTHTDGGRRCACHIGSRTACRRARVGSNKPAGASRRTDSFPMSSLRDSFRSLGERADFPLVALPTQTTGG